MDYSQDAKVKLPESKADNSMKEEEKSSEPKAESSNVARGKLIPIVGESRAEFEKRGLEILKRKQEKSATFIRDLIIEEQNADEARMRHLNELDRQNDRHRNKAYRQAKKAALQLHEIQRAQARSKIDALLTDSEVSLSQLRAKFVAQLEQLTYHES